MRWFWYISTPKVVQLESQDLGLMRRLLGRLSIALELSVANVKAKVSQREGAPESLARRVGNLEERIRKNHMVPTASQIADPRPLFFEFNGRAGKFMQVGFGSREAGEVLGEDFSPAGAFVVAGFEANAAVVLIGNAKNMYGADPSNITISTISQSPVRFLHTLTEDFEEVASSSGEILHDDWTTSPMTPSDILEVTFSNVCEVFRRCESSGIARVKSLAIFGAKIELGDTGDFAKQRAMDWVPLTLKEIDCVIVGSPLYVEQLGE